MRREQVELGSLTLIAHGHYGRPVLVFPSEQGRAWDFENNGMVDAVADLVEAGRVKLYCVDSADAYTWSDNSVSIEERARRHTEYEAWIVDQAVAWIAADCGGSTEIATLGCSLGAFHAANFALKRADLFPLAMCFSGNYDASSWNAWGERGEATYFSNPMDYVANMDGEHLDWLRGQVSLLLVVGQGAWEVHPTKSLPGTLAFAQLLSDKGIRNELDVWGFDIPHEWSSWRIQLAHHLPRFC
jgi:esterase/lipase superfamily enzyme